jgi:hypothetical protein
MKSSLYGLIRSAVGLPFEHPFDNTKTNMQAFNTKTIETVRNIY